MPISLSYNYKYNTMKKTYKLGVKYYIGPTFYDKFGKYPSKLNEVYNIILNFLMVINNNNKLENEIESAYYEKLQK